MSGGRCPGGTPRRNIRFSTILAYIGGHIGSSAAIANNAWLRAPRQPYFRAADLADIPTYKKNYQAIQTTNYCVYRTVLGSQ